MKPKQNKTDLAEGHPLAIDVIEKKSFGCLLGDGDGGLHLDLLSRHFDPDAGRKMGWVKHPATHRVFCGGDEKEEPPREAKKKAQKKKEKLGKNPVRDAGDDRCENH